jgi:Trypsin
VRWLAVAWVLAASLTLALAAPAGAKGSSPRQRAAGYSPARAGALRMYRERRARAGHGQHPPARALTRARAAVVGGREISIEDAPWQVAVVALDPLEGGGKIPTLCGGAILSEPEILTNAECVYDFYIKGDPLVPDEDVLVAAGQSHFKASEAEAKGVHVSEVRVHPYFEVNAVNAPPDDLALLKLEKPLTLGITEKAIALVSEGSILPEGTNTSLASFGEEALAEEPSGALNSLAMTLTYPRRCGGEYDALFLCASSPSGSVCFGDFGSGLELPGSPPLLAGITDYVGVEHKCSGGALGFFANLAAPEIRDWLAGNNSPPHAPRGGGAVIEGVPAVGHSLTCAPGSWSYGPTFTFLFIDSASGLTLQQGPSSTYALTNADVGRTIYCEVRATNAGGTGFGRTPALPAIKPGTSPPAPSSPAPSSSGTASAAAGVSASTTAAGVTSLADTAKVKGKTASVSARCEGTVECEGSLKLVARIKERRTVTRNGKRRVLTRTRTIVIGVAAGFHIPPGRVEKLQVHLTSEGTKLVEHAGHAGLKVTVQGSGVTTGSLVLRDVS